MDPVDYVCLRIYTAALLCASKLFSHHSPCTLRDDGDLILSCKSTILVMLRLLFSFFISFPSKVR